MTMLQSDSDCQDEEGSGQHRQHLYTKQQREEKEKTDKTDHVASTKSVRHSK